MKTNVTPKEEDLILLKDAINSKFDKLKDKLKDFIQETIN